MKKIMFAIVLVAVVSFFNVPLTVLADTTTTSTKSTTKKTTTKVRVCPPEVKVALQDEARQISASYSFHELADFTVEGFDITINNLPKSLYAKVSNKVNDNKLYIKYSNTGNKVVKYNCNGQPIDFTEKEKLKSLINDGTYTFRECGMSKVITYSISIRVDRTGLATLMQDRFYDKYYKIYYDENYSDLYLKSLEQQKGNTEKAKEAAEKAVEEGTRKYMDQIASVCSVDDVRTIKITTPRKNQWYDEIPLCKEDDLKGSYYCQEWVDFDSFKITKSEAIKRLENQKLAKYKTAEASEDLRGKELYDFFVKYGLILVLAIALLVILDIVFIVYNLWRRKEKGKL